MKKIIAAVDALSFTEQELQSYRYLTDKARGELTILFLENIVGDAILATAFETGYIDYEKIYIDGIKAKEEKVEANRKRLLDYFQNHYMDVKVQRLSGDPALEVISESRFADLLLVRGTTAFGFLRNSNPPRFVRELLADAQCPVMVIPENVHRIQEILFTYNGTYSSTYAIRQFTQIFDNLSEVPVKVIYIIEDEEKKIPGGKQIKDYLTHHFEEVTFQSLEGKPSAELLALTMHKRESVATFGAYGRSKASRFFHRSDADSLLRTANIPVFITHP